MSEVNENKDAILADTERQNIKKQAECPVIFEPYCPISFDYEKVNEVAKLDYSVKNGQAACFGDKRGQVICPSAFVCDESGVTNDNEDLVVEKAQSSAKENDQSKQIIKPISFVASVIDLQNGVATECEVPAELAGSMIVRNDDKEKFCNYFLNDTSAKAGNNEIATIIRAVANMRDEDKTEVQDNICNFNLVPLQIEKYFDRNGLEDVRRNKIHFTVELKGTGRKHNLSIKYAEIDDIVKIISLHIPTIVLRDRGSQRTISNGFRERLDEVNVVRCHYQAGWNLIDNKYYYLHKDFKLNDVRVMSQQILPISSSLPKNKMHFVVSRIEELYSEERVIYPLLLFMFQGVLFKVFEQAGFPVRYLLFLNGLTGSYKTAIAEILYIQMVDAEHRKSPRRINVDTTTSIQQAMTTSGADTITLFDDYCPPQNSQQKNVLENNLETLIRIIGDGSTKSRSNINLDDLRGDKVAGAAVVTGEVRGKGLSSTLRCLFCTIEKEKVNLEILTWLQNNSDAVTTLIAYFSEFISKNWSRYVNRIANTKEAYRKEGRKHIEAGRLVDAYANLCITADILFDYLCEEGEQNKEQLTEWLKRVKMEVLYAVIESEDKTKIVEPSKAFMKALHYLCDKGQIKIIHPDSGERDVSAYDGYVDSRYLYVLPEAIYPKVMNHLGSIGYGYEFTLQETVELLAKKELIEKNANGVKKTNYFRKKVGEGTRLKYLKVDISKLLAVAEVEETD